jgi:hypothetical protein
MLWEEALLYSWYIPVLYDFKITRVGQKISLQYIISRLAEELYSNFSKKKDSVPWTVSYNSRTK